MAEYAEAVLPKKKGQSIRSPKPPLLPVLAELNTTAPGSHRERSTVTDIKRIEPRTLKGFRDYLPEAMIPREWLIDTARRVYRSYGFSPIDTPALEYLEILTGKGSDETDKQLYKFEDHGGRWVGLRFDLTVPLARFAAQHIGAARHAVQALPHRHRVARREHAARPLSRVHAVRLRHDRHARPSPPTSKRRW